MEKSTSGTSAWERPRGNGSRGFTLIEILIVVALLAIFVVIAIPNVRRARIRAHMLAQVRTLQQAAAIGKINAIKTGTTLILGIRTGHGATLRLWGDTLPTTPGPNEKFDAGEKIYHDWVLPSDIEVKADPTRALRVLAGGGKGIVFRSDGVVEASSTGDDTGWGAVILKDRHGNQVRLSIAGGTGTVVVQMKNPSGQWTNKLKYWRS